jgi:glycosyltransferase involved in cell wall biosynthesis
VRIGLISLGRRGSGGLFSIELARGLLIKEDLFVLISVDAENYEQWCTSGIHRLETTTYRNHFEAAISLLSPLRLRRIANRIREEQPDVLLFPIYHGWSPFLQYNLRDIPAVVTVHDPEPHPGDIEWILENFSIRQADRCVLLSQSLKQSLIQRGVPAERIDVIPHGPLFYQSRSSQNRNLKLDKGKPVILFFGRITSYKGIDVLINSFKELKSTHHAQLLIVGEGDMTPYNPLLKDLPEVEVINRWIPEDEVGEWFERATIVVLPYTKATQSGVVTIAATYQLPVVATQSGGLPEQIQHGKTGLLVEPGSSDELVQALIRLLDDPEYADDLAKSLHEKYTKVYTWESIASQYLDTCQQAILDRNSCSDVL